MAQDNAPAGRGRSTTPPSTGMWESPPRQMQAHAPFPSWSPYAGTFVAGAGEAVGAHLSPPPAAADSPRLPSEHVPDHAWNQSAQENFLSLLGPRNVAPEMFEDVPAACDYLAGPVGAAASAVAAAGNTGGGAAAYGLGSADRLYSGNSAAHGSSVGCAPRYDHEVKPADGSLQQGFGAPTASSFLQQMIPTLVEIQTALGYSGMGSGRPTESSSFGVGCLPPDAGSFGDYRPASEFMSSNSSRHEQNIRPGMGSSSSGTGAASVATSRRSEERVGVGGNAKKSKQEASRKASPPKAQAPKVKLGEKITALQQIVSPFGKTDTSSVLFETIKYIKFLHEQLWLFSEPYMTKSAHEGHVPFGGEEKEKTGTGHESGLRGRGLCLVPVSLTSQAYHDDTLPDCWTPAYRSCLYR
ncbi:hypothetical protein GQ55_7G247500 [Panicum hallii var. hallii]|uniref:BHLH domain-containing protein n=1 Tax=Panicum hallii var. hallii TaxID=1504633 RepID=A0A2T7CYQ4_9POAL|nr:hypothetical protein GQ55_7G247500 [Panicum hallii var. hallii]